MRTARRLCAAAFIAVAVLLAATVQPAGAYYTPWQTQPWHQGRVLTDWYGGGGYCTSGPIFIGGNGHFYEAKPLHCLLGASGFGTPPFYSVYEGASTDKHDGNNVIWPSWPYTGYDIVLVELGPNSVARSRFVFDYCNPAQSWNCSSHLGGGWANNPNWAGSWRQNVGYFPGNFDNPTSLCQSGAGAGTSCGQSGAAVNEPGLGWVWRLEYLNGCGNTTGDSGAPVYAKSGSGYSYLAGMVVGRFGTSYAGAGNSCYYQGRAYSTTAAFYAVNTIQVLFQGQTGGNLTPY